MEDISRKAGNITLKYFNNPDLEIFEKSDSSPVTRADRESEEYLRKSIREHFPNDVILGEEYGEDGSDVNRRWILDPIDGTQSFIHGVPLYGVMVAIEESGVVTNGCVNFPALSEIVSASLGNGCYWNGNLCHVSGISKIEDALVITTNFRRIEDTPALQNIVKTARTFRGWGDCYGHLLVATGRAEIMLDPKVALWDSAPMGIIIEEAGGKVFDFNGVDTIYSPTLISTNSNLAAKVKELLLA